MSRINHELSELIAEGLLSPDAAEKIRAYYYQKDASQPNRINVVFGIIGSVLVGLGIILIVAHNWDELSRPVKLIFSFTPLLLGQVLCAYSLYKKRGNITWTESSATLLFFAVGACVAMVSQIYNIPGSMEDLLFTWMLLGLPLVYLMPSSVVSLFYIAGITVYGVTDGYGYQSSDSYHYWWLLLLVLPNYLLLIKNQPRSNFTTFHHWFVPASLTICLGTLSATDGLYMTIAYINLFSVFYLIGTSRWFLSRHIMTNAYFIIGSLGTMSILIALTFRGVWSDLSTQREALSISEILAIAITGIMALYLLYVNFRNRDNQPLNLLWFIFLLFAAVFFISLTEPSVAAFSMNVLVLGASIFILLRGQALNHLGLVNYGLLIIAVLVLCRFFDTNLSFVIRGLLFVAVGCGFFFANTRLLKKRNQHGQ